MSLNKDTLGEALYNRSMTYNDQAIDTTDPAAVENYRKNFWKAIADEVINHFKNNGVIAVNVTTTGSAAAQTGTGTGTIS